MSTKKTTEEKIEAYREEKRQIDANIKMLLQQQKEKERKERNRRLCKRGGMVEGLLPDLIKITDEQFEEFVDKCLLSVYATNILSELASKDSDEGQCPMVEDSTRQAALISTAA